MDIYTRLVSGETLTVQFRGQPEGYREGAFQLTCLLLFGDRHYVTEGSEWARFARVSGVVINGVRKHRMDDEEMRAWCEELEVVEDIIVNASERG